MQIGQQIIDYEIHSDYHALLKSFLSLKYTTYFLIYDPVIHTKFIKAARLFFEKEKKFFLVPFEVTEYEKNLSGLSRILEILIKAGVNRSSCLLVLGGGTMGNVVGLAAGLLYRGIDFVHIPTTILACSDSVLSLKQGINMLKSKNIIGMYYRPVKIVICPELYNSLPQRDITAGYVEYVKNLIIVLPDQIENFMKFDFKDATSYGALCSLIKKSIDAKTKLLINDEHERKEGILLEYGHTVGHALEMMYPNVLRHGEGVAFGMLVAGEISNRLGYFTLKEISIQKQLLYKIGVIKNLRRFLKGKIIQKDRLLYYLNLDNKRGYIECNTQEIAMVIMEKIGKPLFTDDLCIINVPAQLVIECVQDIWEEIVQ